MRRVVLLSLACLFALSLAADEYEKVLLTVSPSVVNCGYNSRYDTRLVVFNGHADREVRGLAPGTGRVVVGDAAMTPWPSFFYVRKDEAQGTALSLLVESSDREKPEARAFAEVPVVREREFTNGKIQIAGVRMDEGFRKTLRIYGLDGQTWAPVRVRVYSLTTSKLLFENIYSLMPVPTGGRNEAGQDLAPSFNMECDLSDYWIPNDGTPIRVEVEPLWEQTRIWAFVSVTSNATQHFYSVLPQR